MDRIAATTTGYHDGPRRGTGRRTAAGGRHVPPIDSRTLDAARHAATRNRLIGEATMSEDRADEWLARWAARASQEGRERDAAYWDAAFEWIVGQQS